MFVNLLFDPRFPISTVDKSQFRIDFDATGKIEDLKVLITLNYQDLDPLFFDLYFNNERIPNDKKLVDLNLHETDILLIKAIGSNCPECLLI